MKTQEQKLIEAGDLKEEYYACRCNKRGYFAGASVKPRRNGEDEVAYYFECDCGDSWKVYR